MTPTVYRDVLDHTIIVCVDVVIVNKQHSTFYLAKRIVLPMEGLWCIGGRRMKGENPYEAIVRRFLQETGLDLPKERFKFVDIFEYMWKDREQIPQEKGTHNMAHQFFIELDDYELGIVRANLSPTEYDTTFGLVEMTREEMVEQGVHPAMLEAYDKIFQNF